MSPATGQPGGDTLVVTAVAGFAYGVIGADIHVFGDGAPVYLLFEHRRADSADPRWLRAQPSRMLDARAEVVEFTGRETELDELATWRDADPRFAVRWLHGEGGQGKTRLAARLAADSERLGWKVVDAVHGTDAHPPAPGSQDLRLDGAQGVLLLTDYADRWPLTDLSWLFHNTLLRQGVSVRVLLIARSASAWPSVRGKLDKFRENIDTSDQLLPPMPVDGSARGQMFAAARGCFARLYPQVAEPSAIKPPGPLDHAGFELTLAVHMAALVAVDAAACGRKPPADILGLTVYLLDREHENWRQLYENADRGLDYRTPDRVMARTVFASVLAGPVTESTAASVLGTVMAEAPAGRVLVDHAACYPASDPAMALAPMLPDRLAEDFLALMLPGHTISGFSPDPWATGVADLLLSSADAAACAPRALTRLAAAADRWPHVGTGVLYPLVTGKPQCAINAGSPALAALAAIGSAEDGMRTGLLEVLESVESLLPEGSHVDLDVGTVEVAERLTAYRLAATADPAEQARLYHLLAMRRSNAGRWAKELDADEHAARINRQLNDDDPRYRPVLAMSLNSLANALSHNGRSREALAQSRQSVVLFRELAKDYPRYRADLAMCLTGLSNGLREQGLRDEGLAAIEEAVAIRTELAADSSADTLTGLIRVLNNLSGHLTELDRDEEAVTPARDAVNISRRLVKISPAEHLLHLAISVTTLGVPLLALGRTEEALAAEEEAIELYRRLAEANPAAHRPGLVRALANASVPLSRLGRHDEALARSEEAVQLARQLTDDDPALYRGALARSLRSLGQDLVVHSPDDALAAFREAFDLAEKGPGYETADIALMRRLAAMYRDLGDRENEALVLLSLGGAGYRRDHGGEATTAARRAAEIYRETGDRESEVGALINLGALLQDEDSDEAIEIDERAVAISRELGRQKLEGYALSNLSDALIHGQRSHEAVGPARRACRLLQELGEYDGPALHNLGRALMESGETEQAINVLRQVGAVYRRTGKGEYEDSGRPRQDADAHGFLGDALAREGKFAEAVDAYRRAADLSEALGGGEKARKALLAGCANLFKSGDLAGAAALSEETATRCRAVGDRKHEAIALSYIGAVRNDEGQYEEAIAPCEQAVALFREVDDPDLADQEAAALTNLGKIMSSLKRDEESGTAYEQAVAKWREAGQELGEYTALYGSALFGLGKALFLQHRYEEAARACQDSVQVYRGIGDQSGEAMALYALAGALVETERFETAAEAARRAAFLFHDVGRRRNEAAALGLLRAAWMGLRRFDDAVAAARMTAAAWRSAGDSREEAIAEGELGRALSKAGHFQESAAASERAAMAYLQLGDHRGEALAMRHLSDARREEGRPNEAVTAAERSVAAFRDCGDRNDEANALFHLGMTLGVAERHDEAIDVSRRAAAYFGEIGQLRGEAGVLFILGDSLDKLHRFEDSVPVYQRCAEIEKNLGNTFFEDVAISRLRNALAERSASQQERGTLRRRPPLPWPRGRGRTHQG